MDLEVVVSKIREIVDFGFNKTIYDLDCAECPIANSEVVNCHGTNCHYHLLNSLHYILEMN